MPALKIHTKLSHERTGNYYDRLHEWIDERKGINHRQLRHYYTTSLRKFVFDNFGGQEAVNEWLFHLALDNLSTLTTHSAQTEFYIRFVGKYVRLKPVLLAQV